MEMALPAAIPIMSWSLNLEVQEFGGTVLPFQWVQMFDIFIIEDKEDFIGYFWPGGMGKSSR